MPDAPNYDSFLGAFGYFFLSLKMASMFSVKEKKICYKMVYYTLCLDSVNREKLHWKVRI